MRGFSCIKKAVSNIVVSLILTTAFFSNASAVYINDTEYEELEHKWPVSIKPPDGAPNILIWLIDDAGFSQIGSFGGLIETPNIDKLARQGLRYNNFHTTGLGSPSRAALLYGRNHHSIGMGGQQMTSMGFPGYNGRVPKSAASIARILQMNGYATYAIGKWDNAPGCEVTISGPFERWPTGEGFERFYGFMSVDVNNFRPEIWSDHTPIQPALGKKNYHLTTDMADKAIDWITAHKSANPNKPLFMYWATGAVHAPHHAPKKFRDKYKGKFKMGWDKARRKIFNRQKEMGIIPMNTELTKKPKDIDAWEDLSDAQKRIYVRQMEAFAAQLDHADREFGRIIDTLERIGELDNTLIIVTSDNGASGEGGVNGSFNEMIFANQMQTTLEENSRFYSMWGSSKTYNHYHAGWAMAGNTPFKYFKQTIHRGGTHNPFIIFWPNGIEAKGEIRSQYHHIIDLAPSLLEIIGIDAPEEVDGIKQKPMDGVSMMYSFNNPFISTEKEAQYYEIYGNRGIWKDGWKAVTIHGNRMPWKITGRYLFEYDIWELYHVKKDFSESNNLAEEYPMKLKNLKKLWKREARKYNVYPLNNDIGDRIAATFNENGQKLKRFTYYSPGAKRIPEAQSPPIKQRSHMIIAEVYIPKTDVNGVIAASGGNTGGYALFIKDNKLIYIHNYLGKKYYKIISNTEVPKGQVTLSFKLTWNLDKESGYGELLADGERIGEGRIDKFVPIVFSYNETFDIGEDSGTSVSDDYTVPYNFTGRINKVIFELK